MFEGSTPGCQDRDRTCGSGDNLKPLDAKTKPEAAFSLDYQSCEPTDALLFVS